MIYFGRGALKGPWEGSGARLGEETDENNDNQGKSRLDALVTRTHGATRSSCGLELDGGTGGGGSSSGWNGRAGCGRSRDRGDGRRGWDEIGRGGGKTSGGHTRAGSRSSSCGYASRARASTTTTTARSAKCGLASCSAIFRSRATESARRAAVVTSAGYTIVLGSASSSLSIDQGQQSKEADKGNESDESDLVHD